MLRRDDRPPARHRVGAAVRRAARPTRDTAAAVLIRTHGAASHSKRLPAPRRARTRRRSSSRGAPPPSPAIVGTELRLRRAASCRLENALRRHATRTTGWRSHPGRDRRFLTRCRPRPPTQFRRAPSVALAARMLGSTRRARPTSSACTAETCGYAAGDSVDVAVDHRSGASR